MLKWLREIDWAAIVGAALVLAFVFAVFNPSAKQPKNECPPSQQESECYQDGIGSLARVGAFFDRYRDDINAASTSVIALFTIALVAVGYVQSRSLRDTIRTMDATAERQLRAYVLVTEASIVAVDLAGQIIRPLMPIQNGVCAVCEIVFMNTGETPAYNVHIVGDAKVVDWPINAADLQLPRTPEGTKESLGRGIHRSKFDRLPVFSVQEIRAIKDGGRAVCAYGQITYSDAFGTDRTTNYRVFIGGPIGVRGTAMSAHDYGNESD